MSTTFILALLFLGITLAGYSLLASGTRAIETRADRLQAATDTRLRQMFVFADTRRLVALYGLAIVGVPALLLFLDQAIPVVLLALLAVLAAPHFVLQRLAERRRIAINRALPDALAQVSGAMQAGATFSVALQSVVDEQHGPLGQELGLMLREQRVGARMEEALDNLGERVQSEEMDLVISAALIAQEVGGNLAEILQRLSVTIRRKLEMENRIKALTSQGVLQGRVVTALPFAILAALMFFEPEATRPIFTGILGWGFLFVIVVMQLIGGLMIRKIVRIDI